MQPERSKGGDNYQHVVIRLRGPVVRARPEHDVADAREVFGRLRVRVREYLPGQSVYMFFFFVSSHSPLFLLLFVFVSLIFFV